MTPEEHEALKWRMKSLAQEVLLDWLSGILRMQYGLLPAEQLQQTLKTVQRKLQEQKREYSTLTVEGVHPALSDMQTALFQESFDDLSKELLSTLGRGLTAAERHKLSR